VFFHETNKERVMQGKYVNATGFRAVIAVGGLLFAGLAGNAFASCADTPSPAVKQASPKFMPAVYRTDGYESAAYTLVSDEGWRHAPIVGLWKFEVHLNGAQNGLPDKFLFDWGLATWHEDGTEIQFSAGRPPASGDVCMGAWEQVGWSKFKLNHLALGLTPPDATGAYIGPANIKAEVTVDKSGNTYSGEYTLVQYAASTSGVPFSEFDQNTPVATFKATITAVRVTVD
jgi:hypothetical protein